MKSDLTSLPARVASPHHNSGPPMQDHCDTLSNTGVASAARSGARGSAILRLASVGVLALGAGTVMSSQARAAALDPAQFNSIAAACAPGISGEVLRSVAVKESHFEPFALHNNTKSATRIAVDPKSAAALAQKWIAAGDSVDLGLMQINSKNLVPLGLTLTEAFDPCKSIAAGAAVLHAAYARGATFAQEQAALLIALSRYNTGGPLNGVVNGYVQDVLATGLQEKATTVPQPNSGPARGQAPPSWDMWANAAYARTNGADWLVLPPQGSPSSPTGTAAEVSNQPIPISLSPRRSP